MALIVWIVGLCLVWFPGRLLDQVLRLRTGGDLLTRGAVQIGLGLSFYPLVFLWTSMAGFQWNPFRARVFLGIISVAAVVSMVRDLPTRRLLRRHWPWFATLAAVGILVIVTRVGHARELALPAWVDSLHHMMITRLLVSHGELPQNYAPFIDGAPFYYHWGFHSVLAFLAMILGRSDAFEMARLMLDFGQLLNALFFVMTYAAGRVLFRSHSAGLLSAVLVTLFSFFPAYYVSWGRYTHLTGMLLLPPLAILLWRVHERPLIGRVIATAVVAAGLALVHVRVALFALILAIVLAVIVVRRQSWRTLGWWAAAAVAALVLISPWTWALYQSGATRLVEGAASAVQMEMDRMVPIELIWSPMNRELFALATFGLTGIAGWLGMPVAGRIIAGFWWVLLVLLSWLDARGRLAARVARPWGPLILLLTWCGLIAFLLNVEIFGFAPGRIASNSSAIISMFLPLSLAAGGLLAWVWESTPMQRSRWVGLTVVITLACYGTSRMTTVINPVTVLAEDRDLAALRWIRQNAPRNAVFAIEARPWIAPSYMGTDGGYWISILSDRRSTVPPALYAWTMPGRSIEQINWKAALWSGGSNLDEDAALLRRHGVTHVYAGAPTPHYRLGQLLRSKSLKVIYRDAGVHVFEISSSPASPRASSQLPD